MMIKARVVVVLVCWLVQVAAFNRVRHAQAQEPLEKDRVLPEYRAALFRMESFFSRLRVQGTYTTNYETMQYTQGQSPANASAAASRAIVFARDDRRKKLVRRRIGNDSVPEGESYEMVYCQNSKYGFALRKAQWNSPYLVKGVEAGESRDIGEAFDDFNWPVISIPCSLGGRPLSEIFTSSGFALKRITALTDNGRAVVKIEFDFHWIKDHPELGLYPAWIMVDPSNGWALQRYEIHAGRQRDYILSGVVEYGPSLEGMPVPRRVTHGNRDEEDRFEFEQFIPGPVAESEFTLAAFGLPDLVSQPRRGPRTIMPYILMGVSVVVILSAVGLKFLSMRRARV